MLPYQIKAFVNNPGNRTPLVNGACNERAAPTSICISGPDIRDQSPAG